MLLVLVDLRGRSGGMRLLKVCYETPRSRMDLLEIALRDATKGAIGAGNFSCAYGVVADELPYVRNRLSG